MKPKLIKPKHGYNYPTREQVAYCKKARLLWLEKSEKTTHEQARREIHTLVPILFETLCKIANGEAIRYQNLEIVDFCLEYNPSLSPLVASEQQKIPESKEPK